MTAMALPSFSEQLAVVYDDYMATLGGGERSALAYALALKQLDFKVEILCRFDLPSRSRIAEAFGDEFSNISIRKIKTQDVYAYLKPAELSVFVNHTFMNFAVNPARLGIYSQMFPVSSIFRSKHRQEVQALDSYQLMFCNSTFTHRYTVASWDYPEDRCHVLHPPIGTEFIVAAERWHATTANKKQQFVHIGRFNPGTHNKNQKIIIESFLEAKSRFDELSDWQLLLIGNSNTDAASKEYLQECRDLIKKSRDDIKLLEDVPAAQLQAILRESFGYVHATGAFIGPGFEPFKCEHLGLSIVEAMASGCIPLVYARGGIFDILVPGVSGLPYISYEGLVEGYREIASLFGTSDATAMQNAGIKAALQLSQAKFTQTLARFVAKGLVK